MASIVVAAINQLSRLCLRQLQIQGGAHLYMAINISGLSLTELGLSYLTREQRVLQMRRWGLRTVQFVSHIICSINVLIVDL